MANLAKLEFVVLDVSGNNYLSWVLDAELHLSANSLKDTIDPEKISIVEQNTKATIFLRHHIHEDLKSEERDFQKYGELISLLLVAEKNNELLLKNRQIRPTGSAQLPEWQHDGYNSDRQKWQREVPNKRKAPKEGENRDICHVYGSERHWQHTCRTLKHLVDLYESSKRNNEKRVGTNFANYNLVNEPVNKASNEIDTGTNLYYGLDD
ncbi:uncharacterized protein LOC141691337 [Apium graveolens]|uniref:uncharacterized protein LOC141691337 n=1 Tax=Apium graveolens TaxID=4045 RepID=UPI003D7ACD32